MRRPAVASSAAAAMNARRVNPVEVILRAANPRGERLPLGIVLRRPVFPALVPRRSARLGRKRIEEQDAPGRITRRHESRDAIEIAARLILGPHRRAWRQRLEVRARAARVARVAAGIAIAGSLREEDRFNPGLEDVVIELRRRWGGRRLRVEPEEKTGGEHESS